MANQGRSRTAGVPYRFSSRERSRGKWFRLEDGEGKILTEAVVAARRQVFGRVRVVGTSSVLAGPEGLDLRS